MQEQDDAGREQAEKDEQGEFEPEEAGAFDVGHGKSWR
jgi:hypothetical protein